VISIATDWKRGLREWQDHLWNDHTDYETDLRMPDRSTEESQSHKCPAIVSTS
jgi:hypothetical protein